jgi:integrating conjugative element protein (TIGR03761 family)
MRAEQSVATPPDPQGPGALRGQVWLILQSRQAQQLFRGRTGSMDKPAIIGLVGFADRLRLIWQAARSDDPYADWWLLKIHDAIEQARQLIRSQQGELDSQLGAMPAIEVSVAASLRPYRVPLQFANPYAYRGAQLLAAYDTLVCTVLTARHIGVLEQEASAALLNRCSRLLRGIFAIPQGYRFLGIDREALHAGTGKSASARELMGEVPPEILSGDRRAPLVPRKMNFPSGYAGNVGLRSESPAASTKPTHSENDDG